jgi:post-segregation antitoxin (ccd killing protein)
MKISLYICLIATLTCANLQNGFAQKTAFDNAQSKFATGSWQVGLKEGYGRGNLFKNRNGLHFHTGYYIVNNLLVGVGAVWSKEWFGDYNLNDFTVGPFARYQFLNTRISPFMEASYQFGQQKQLAVQDRQSAAIRSTFINTGLSIRLVSQLRADLSYGLQFANNNQSFGQAQLGLNYLFNKRL